jgi:hypothetical protein
MNSKLTLRLDEDLIQWESIGCPLDYWFTVVFCGRE